MKTMAALGLLCLCPLAAAAQTGGVDINDLAAPTSPAFVLLDVAPASVERPDNPKAFALNLVNHLAGSDGLPKDYAMEVAPYWLTSHPSLTFRQYQRPHVWQSIAQTFSLSIATAPIDDAAEDDPGRRLGLGVRTQVWNGRPNETLEERVAELEAINGVILDRLAQGLPIDEQRAQARIKALEIQGLDAERLGFFLAVAGGQVWSVPEGDTRLAEAQRRAVWVTPSYRLRTCNAASPECVASLDFIGVVRTLKDPGKDAAWDYGGRLLWRPNRQLYLSIEALRRHAPGEEVDPEASRTVGMLEYRIRPDLAVYGSFGRDFEEDGGVRPLVSIMGLNIGFGRTPSVQPVTKPSN